jgi:hypothetical protein
MENNINLLHFYRIHLYGSNGKAFGPKETLFWDNMNFQQRTKWDWYFKYRAALLQVQNPKLQVECNLGSYPAEGKKLIETLKDKLSSKKRKHTEWSNKLKAFKFSWNELFPIEEDERYKNALAKIDRLNEEIIGLTAYLSGLTENLD